MTPGPPYTSTNPHVSVSASALPGANISGRLCGVVSLTDILNLFVRIPVSSKQISERSLERTLAIVRMLIMASGSSQWIVAC